MIRLSLHRTHYPHAAHNEVRVNVVTFSARLLVCFQSAHMFAGGIMAENMGEIKKKKKKREGQHKGFSRQTNGGLDCSDTATGHTLPVAHTLLHTSPIRPDDCLRARWHGTSLPLTLTLFPLSPCTAWPQDTNTHNDPSRAWSRPGPESSWPRLSP